MKDAPAFDFYPERWLVGVAAFSDAEQLAYLRLLCHQWMMEGLPADISALRRLAGRGVTEALLEKFPVGGDGRRRNARLESVRQEQRDRIAKSRDKIAKMNAAREAARGSTSCSTNTSTRASTRASTRGSQEGSCRAPHHSPLTTHPVLLEKEPKQDGAAAPADFRKAALPLPDSVASALKALYHRKDSTPWHKKEIAAARQISARTEEQLLAEIAQFTKARNAGWQFYRRDLLTLLNNWNGEVERSQDFLQPPHANGHHNRTYRQTPVVTRNTVPIAADADDLNATAAM